MKLAAIAAFVLVGLAVGQTIRPIPDTQIKVVGQVPADQWVYVVLNNSSPYTVPIDRYFVVVASLGSATDYSGVAVSDNSPGFRLAITNSNLSFGSFDLRANDARAVFQPGSTVSIFSGELKLWGYLEPVR